MLSRGLLTTVGFCLAADAAAPAAVRAEPPTAASHTDVQFGLLRYQGGNSDPRPTGLPRLAWEVSRRTSIEIDLSTAAVDPNSDHVFDFPLLVWQGEGNFPPLSDRAIAHLRQHLMRGGTLLVDVSDAIVDGPFHTAVQRDLRRIFPDRPVVQVPPEHVLYKSFYLLDRHGGRVMTRAFLEGVLVEDRLAVIISTNDLAGALARDPLGGWQYDVGSGGEATREVTVRLGINVLMYALCLNYKEDRVHIATILQRRR